MGETAAEGWTVEGPDGQVRLAGRDFEVITKRGYRDHQHIREMAEAAGSVLVWLRPLSPSTDEPAECETCETCDGMTVLLKNDGVVGWSEPCPSCQGGER